MQGRCLYCNSSGHRAAQFRKNSKNKNVENGVVKKAGESVEKNDKLTRTKKCRMNRLKKKEEEKKNAKLGAAKQSPQIVVYNASETEED